MKENDLRLKVKKENKDLQTNKRLHRLLGMTHVTAPVRSTTEERPNTNSSHIDCGNVTISLFLLGRSMKVAVKVQISETIEIDADVLQSSLHARTFLLCHINDLSRSILKSLINIYEDNTSIYRCTLKDQAE